MHRCSSTRRRSRRPPICPGVERRHKRPLVHQVAAGYPIHLKAHSGLAGSRASRAPEHAASVLGDRVAPSPRKSAFGQSVEQAVRAEHHLDALTSLGRVAADADHTHLKAGQQSNDAAADVAEPHDDDRTPSQHQRL